MKSEESKEFEKKHNCKECMYYYKAFDAPEGTEDCHWEPSEDEEERPCEAKKVKGSEEMSECVYMDLNGNCTIVECVHKERVCDARKERCEYETNEGHYSLNECLYGDFLVRDDSQFDSGRYCYCNGVTDKMKEQLKENNND